jgi:tetratricopeptide (TPR) repeat protein
VVIGVSDEDHSTVNAFLTDQGWDEKMEYAVATDPDRSTYEAYMDAAGQGGIPTSFVIGKTGEVEWIGHPMQVDPVIKAIMSDTWDREKYAAEQKVKEAAMLQLQAAYPMVQSEETAEEGYRILRENIKPFWDDAMILNSIAWAVLTDPAIAKRDLDLALEFSERAMEVTEGKQGSIIDTAARAHYERGDLKKAIELQKKAVENAEEGMEEQLKQTLAEYEKEAGGGEN